MYLLSFQAINLPEGMVEFIILMRGVAMAGMQVMHGDMQPALWTMFGELQAANDILWEDIPLIWDGQTNLSLGAIMGLEPLCAKPLVIEYQKKLLSIAADPSSTHNTFELYVWWMTLPPHDFWQLIDLNDQVMLLMHAHWVALAIVMVAVAPGGVSPGRQPGRIGATGQGFVRWLRYINFYIDDEHRMYNEWPMRVEDSLKRLLPTADRYAFGAGEKLSWEFNTCPGGNE